MPPISRPSFECAKPVLDAGFVRKVESRFPHNRFDGRISSGADEYVAGADVINLKGIGASRAKLLKSRAFNIHTIGEFAAHSGNFDVPWARLDRQTIETLRSLHAALQVCSNGGATVGRKVEVRGNDPSMQASVVPGKDVIGHNQGEEGSAVISLRGDPSNDGFVASFLNIDLGGYTARGRGGMITFEPVNIRLGPGLPSSVVDVAEQIKAKLEEQGLAAVVERPREGPDVRVRVWSPVAID